MNQIGKFNPQDIANMAWAFATLGIHSDCLMEALALEAESQIQEFDPQAIANMAWAFASLGFRSNRLMQAFALAAESQIQNFTPQNLTNTAWAFALLENEGSSLFRSIAGELNNRSHHTFNAASIQQLLQAQSALKFYGVDFSLIPSHWKLEAPASHCRISGFQREVGSCLEGIAASMGRELKTEFFIHEIAHSIDFTVGEIAFEIDGPFHFAHESHKRLGPTLFRNRLLKQLGWKLVCIPYWEWEVLKTAEEKQRYLDQKIREALR